MADEVDPRVAASESPTVELERLVYFSDAVFAIVITVLVLPLIEQIELPEQGQDGADPDHPARTTRARRS